MVVVVVVLTIILVAMLALVIVLVLFVVRCGSFLDGSNSNDNRVDCGFDGGFGSVCVCGCTVGGGCGGCGGCGSSFVI